MAASRSLFTLLLILLALAAPAGATAPKIDEEQCKELRLEQAKFIESGVLADLARGPEWGKSNLTPDKLRQVELYIMLDEQLKFGCRDAKISPDAARAGRTAIELDIPTVPPIDIEDAKGTKTPQIITIEPDPAAEAPKPRKKPKAAGQAAGAPKPAKPLSGENFLFP